MGRLGQAVDGGAAGHKNPPRGRKADRRSRVGGAASRESHGAGAPEKPVLRRSGPGGSPELRPPALSRPGAA
ncbi:hypothetical protein NDU88_006537 [Pleurodeles waltl]|uniref:Uncharacterized protein n=1 Tax=Pleurodeles waltl TaxID=8319 RepID=A0AAV7VRU8_PLEWA|nr:hypothetical protein NDU88_006537 [Pleurodeles waltl]